MASSPPVAVAVLAAGQSRRFGAADKLAAQFRGKPLGLHVTETLARLPFTDRWLITSAADHPCVEGWRATGFTPVLNPYAATGMGSSVALAARLAQEAKARALLIVLADMPLVTALHFSNLIERAAPDALYASHTGTAPTPPAMFGSDHFAALQEASGDQGARALLRRAGTVPCDAAHLIDIDDPETLARLS